MAVTLPAPAAAPVRRRFHIALSVFMTLIAVVGFWPKYFGPLVLGTLDQPLLIHIHATVFTGWLALFFAQAYFAATKRLRWHLALGRAGMWYGGLLIVVGLTTGVLRAAGHMAQGDQDAERLLLVSTADMVVFAGFFLTALYYRKKPALHRRAMVVAATALLIAAVARMPFLPDPPPGLAVRLAVWSLPVLIGIAYDFWTTRRIHALYLVGLAVFAVRVYGANPLAHTQGWRAAAHAVFAFVS